MDNIDELIRLCGIVLLVTVLFASGGVVAESGVEEGGVSKQQVNVDVFSGEPGAGSGELSGISTQSHSSSAPPGGEWLEVSSDDFIVKYRDGYESDASEVLDKMQQVKNQSGEVLPESNDLELTLDNRIRVYVYPDEEWTRSDYVIYWEPTNPVRVHTQAPSESPNDDDWFDHGLGHEYINIVLWDYYEDNKPDEVYESAFQQVPDWYFEGVTEHYTFKLDMVDEEWPTRSVEGLQAEIEAGNGYFDVISGKPYDGGSLIAEYMISEYGEEDVLNMLLLVGEEDTHFTDAVAESFGVSYVDMKNNWLVWAGENIGGEYNVEEPTQNNTDEDSELSKQDVNITVELTPIGTDGNSTYTQSELTVSEANRDDVQLLYQNNVYEFSQSNKVGIPLRTTQTPLTVKFNRENQNITATCPVKPPGP